MFTRAWQRTPLHLQQAHVTTPPGSGFRLPGRPGCRLACSCTGTIFLIGIDISEKENFLIRKEISGKADNALEATTQQRLGHPRVPFVIVAHEVEDLQGNTSSDKSSIEEAGVLFEVLSIKRAQREKLTPMVNVEFGIWSRKRYELGGVTEES